MNIEDLISPMEYLILKGHRFTRKGSLYYTNSPFNTNDRTPSFVQYPSRLFKCYSTGKVGNVITLARHFGDSLSSLEGIKSTFVAPPPYETRSWNGIPKRYLDVTKEEAALVHRYAESRKITSGYHPAVTFHKEGNDWVREGPSMMMPHENNGVITGAKFRFVEPIRGQRFTSRGKLGFYILRNNIESYEVPECLVIEGEMNANSLLTYCNDIGKPVVVASAGSVTSIPKELPCGFKTGRLLVDFDDDETKYLSRLELYRHLPLLPIRLILPKGSDINSLAMEGKLGLLNSII
jgi:hypothetical protein